LTLSVFDSNFVAGLNQAREAAVSFSTDSLKVLTLIGRQGPISRTRIGRLLNFTPSRVTRLSAALLASNLIHEIGREESTGGRRSTLLALRENHHVLCGVGISYSSVVEVVLMDLRANILEEEKFVLPSETEPEDLVDRIEGAFKACLANRDGLAQRVVGIGLGMSGLVNPFEGVVHSSRAFPQWHEVDLGAMLSKRMGLPVYLDNEVAMATLAELWFGQGRGSENFLYFSVGPGLRMGIVIDGNLYRGGTGNAGELGHITYDDNGPICHCGNVGCLEVFVSSDALLDQAHAALKSHSTSILVSKCKNRSENLQLWHIYQAASEGDRLALTLIRGLCTPLGRTLANIVNIFDTERLVIGGNLAQGGQIVLDILREHIQLRSLPVRGRNVQLELAAFGTGSPSIGAGALILQKVCEGEITV